VIGICYTIFVKWIDAKKETITILCGLGKATSLGFWGHGNNACDGICSLPIFDHWGDII
jgi:hypothetical protein